MALKSNASHWLPPDLKTLDYIAPLGRHVAPGYSRELDELRLAIKK